MKNKTLIAGLMLVGALGACALQKQPLDNGPWGYDFALGKFNDLREDADAQRVEQRNFLVEDFMHSWDRHTKRDLFAHQNATLDVTLNRYEATQSGRSYAVTMDVDLRGRDVNGRILAEKPLRCVVVDTMDMRHMGDSVQQAVSKADGGYLTPDGRESTMWQRVFDKCVRELTIQFGQALYAGV